MVGEHRCRLVLVSWGIHPLRCRDAAATSFIIYIYIYTYSFLFFKNGHMPNGIALVDECDFCWDKCISAPVRNDSVT